MTEPSMQPVGRRLPRCRRCNAGGAYVAQRQRCAAMTDHHPQPAGPPPTARQQRYLRQLAMQRGIPFVPPRTRFEASRLIDELKRRRPDGAADRRREIRAVQNDMASRRGDAARVIDGVDTTGHGSSATWKGGQS